MRSGTQVLVRFVLTCVVAGTLACSSRDETFDAREKAPAPAPAPSSPPPRPAAALQPDVDRERSNDPTIVVMGDSLTAGLGLSLDEAYPAVLQRRLKAAGLKYIVRNAGISGDTSAGGLSRIDLALEGNVRILIVALGANDGLRGLPPAQLKQNLAQIIEKARARGVSVILAGMEAPPNWGSEYTAEFHSVYSTLAAQYHIPLVPFLLANVAGIPELNQRDGIHPTAEGDRIVAETVWKVLEPLAAKLAVRGEGSPGS